MNDYYERQKQKARQRAREAIERGRILLWHDLSSLTPQEVADAWLAAVAACHGDDIAEESLIHYSHGWYLRRTAQRFGDGSIGCPGGLESQSSMRRDVIEASIRELLRRAAAKGDGDAQSTE